MLYSFFFKDTTRYYLIQQVAWEERFIMTTAAVTSLYTIISHSRGLESILSSNGNCYDLQLLLIQGKLLCTKWRGSDGR